jgi:hypothetical protein
MGEQRAEAPASKAVEKAKDIANDVAKQAHRGVEGKLDQGKTIIQDVQTRAGEALDKATDFAQQASTVGGEAITQAGNVIQGVAREVGKQADQAATPLYQKGARTSGYVSRYAADQPLAALLVAGAIGYGLAYLIHRS